MPHRIGNQSFAFAQAASGPRAPIRNLDLLRAVAVLLVVIDHLLTNGLRWLGHSEAPLLAMGRLGVMIFFVHTSLVLMLSMERMSFDALELGTSFYIRRIFRIYPLSLLTVLGVMLFNIPYNPFEAFHKMSLLKLWSNLVLIQNITRTGDAIGPLWSLPWEVQMYLLLPLVFLALRAGRLRAVAAALLCLAIVDAAGVGAGYRVFRILDYVPCFAGGILAYFFVGAARTQGASRARVSAFLWPLALLLLVATYATSGFAWPVRRVFYPDWVVCAILGFLIPRFRDLPVNILSVVTHFIAKYSYGIYLFHLPAIWLAFDHLRGIGVVASVMVCIATTVLLSVGAYHLVEEPMIRLGKRLAAHPESRSLGICGVPSLEKT
jgi:peptidoglycan/LPS O-acetylase OafA/YrhL